MLTEYSTIYSPIYHELVEITKKHERAHWVEAEVKLQSDVEQWRSGKITEEEKRLVKNILRLFTQADCYHPDTEFLTDRGWKKFEEITDDVLLAEFDNNRNVRFSKPLHKIKKDYSGLLYSIKDGLGRTNQLVTENHQLVVYKGDEWFKTNASSYKPQQNNKIAFGGFGSGEFKEISPLDMLKIAFQADGSLPKDVDGSKSSGVPHRFGFSKQRKKDALEKILTLLNYEWVKRDSGNYTYYTVYLDQKLDKDFEWVDITKVSSEWCRQFMLEISKWDSHVDKWGKVKYTNTNRVAAEKVGLVALLTGSYYTTGYSTDPRSDRYSDIMTVSWQPSKEPLVNGQSLKRYSSTEEYNGEVVCFTMPLGTLVTRLNGSVAFSGNCNVGMGYYDKLIPFIKNNEARNMFGSFAAREGTHQRAYALLNDTLGFGEDFYEEFLSYQEMKEKHEFMIEDIGKGYGDFAKYLAKQTLIEGVVLFASFAILLNFDRKGKLAGMCDVVRWSQIDESLHIEGNTALFRQFCAEHPRIVNDEFKRDIYQCARDTVELEDHFLDLVFSLGGVDNLTKEEVKDYIRYVTDYRLVQLGLKPNWGIEKNPIPWIDYLMGSTFGNFFEREVVEYSKGNTSGEWVEGYKNSGSKFTVFTKPDCPYCVKLKRFLGREGFTFTEVDVTQKPDSLKHLHELGLKTVPQIFDQDGNYHGDCTSFIQKHS